MDFSELFDRFDKYAFRLEGLGHYSVPASNKRFELFQRGEEIPAELYSNWVNTISSARARGARMQRLRLLSSPPTLYERFETEAGYKQGVLAGEDIRTLSHGKYPFDYDFWAFDDATFAQMNYDTTGNFLGFDVIEMTADRLALVNHWRQIFHEEATKIYF